MTAGKAGWAALSNSTRIAIVAAGAACSVSVCYLIWDSSGTPEPMEAPVPLLGQTETDAPAPPATEPRSAEAKPGEEAAETRADVAPPKITTWAVAADGVATISGEAEPGALVRVLLDEMEIVTTPATRRGEFAVVTQFPPKPAPSLMTISMQLPDGRSIPARESVAIGPISGPATVTAPAEPVGDDTATATAPVGDSPASAAEDAVAAVPEGTAPTALLVTEEGVSVLQAPTAAPIDAITLETISYADDGAVQFGGRGQKGAVLRFHLDDVAIQDLAVSDDGRWSATLRDIAPGLYRIRLDQLDDNGRVTSRFETPFKRESLEALAAAMDETPQVPETSPPAVAEALAETAAPLSPGEEGAEPATVAQAPDPVLPSAAESAGSAPAAPVRITVQPGHTLWAIARDSLGKGVLYVQVYEANRDLIRNPDLIYPGQVFSIPAP